MKASIATGRAGATKPYERPVAVVTVTYNSADVIGGLLDSMERGLAGVPNHSIIVADNASSDESVAICRAHPARPQVISTGRNGGYAAGINAALAAAGPDADVVILNPDIRLAGGAIRPLLESFRDGKAGIALPHIVHDDMTPVESLRREPSLLTAWTEALLGGRIASTIGCGEIVRSGPRYRADGPAVWGSGAAMAISAEARGRIGLWDEAYFLYSEEVDYQRRARDLGIGVAFVSGSKLVHIGGEYRRSPRLYAILTANRIRYYARHHGPLATLLFQAAIVAGEAIRSLRGSLVHRSGLRAAIDWPRGHWSPVEVRQEPEALA